MDKLDSILLEAWNRVGEKLRRKRISALKRSRRRLKGVLTRPMREWCLVIRASDTRITAANAIVERVDGEEEAKGQACQCDPFEAEDLRFNDGGEHHCHEDLGCPIAKQEAHTVTLDGKLIRELAKPVVIAWPGVTYEEAARRCGREWKTIKSWIRAGVFKIDHYAAFSFPNGNRRGKGVRPGSHGGFGGRPYVWTESAIDPNNFQGRPPHKVWGSLWQTMWEDLPEEYELVVRREPSFRPRKGVTMFRGWNWICPGRIDENGEYKGCGRRCRYLYGPQTVWTLARAIAGGDEDGFEMPPPDELPKEFAASGLRLAGQWFPGASDPIRNAARGVRSFACKTCWGVRSACMANYNGWNEFIAQISGGLLYGRDVERPTDICPVKRKKREYTWKRSRPPKVVEFTTETQRAQR